MKKKTIVTAMMIVSFIGMLFLIEACRNENDKSTQSNPYDEIIAKHARIGMLHNTGLDLIIKNISPSTRAGIDPDDPDDPGNPGEDDFEIDDDFYEDIVNVSYELFLSQLAPEEVEAFHSYFGSANYVDLYNEARAIPKAELENYFSAELNSYLTALESIVNDSDTYLPSIVSRIEAMEYDACSNLSGYDLDMFLTLSSISKSSMAYWHDNYLEWLDAMGVQLTRGWFNWKRMGQEDFNSGWACVGIVGLGSLLFGPPGWVIAAACIGGGALAGSAWDAWDQYAEREDGDDVDAVEDPDPEDYTAIDGGSADDDNNTEDPGEPGGGQP